jgi:ribosomal protein S18 acetylase RimI-like enzyme
MNHIRVLRRGDDLGDLIALSKAFFKEYESHHKEFFKIDHLSDRDIIDYFSRWIDNQNGTTFIALDEDHIVGYMTAHLRDQPAYWQIKQVGDISGLMVHKDFRRRGIGSQLLAQARVFFAKRGVNYFVVSTAAENKGAIEFYKCNGLWPLYATMAGTASEGRENS